MTLVLGGDLESRVLASGLINSMGELNEEPEPSDEEVP